MMTFVIVTCAVIVIYCIYTVQKERGVLKKREVELQNNIIKLNDDKKKSLDEIEHSKISAELLLKKEKESLEAYQNTKEKEFERLLRDAKELKNELENGFLRGRKWLADAYSEYIDIKDGELQCSLLVKPNPALKSAELVAEIRRSKAELIKKLKFLEYQVKSYEEYFPELIDYKIAILDELIDFRSERIEDNEEIDPALKYGYISKEDYQKKSDTEKFQMALDQYWKREKSNLEIGRVYERYIGYLHEKDGWEVKYDGIIKGFEDFGRDLICSKNGETLVIQCKCWAKEKVIREKHIMQLFGTTVLYEYEHKISKVTPVFFTTTKLSEAATLVADRLGIQIRYEDLKRYPMIKCNINQTTKEKIYHLPFDQQYDKIILNIEEGKFYANTIIEAESHGFRRAFRWSGNE
jgi:hypothetical protein